MISIKSKSKVDQILLMKKILFLFFTLNILVNSYVQKVKSNEFKKEIGFSSNFLNGMELINKGQFTEGVKKCEEAIKILPEEKLGYLCKGIGLGFSGKSNTKREAIKSFTKAIKIDPKFYEAYFWRGALQFSMKRRHMDKTDRIACSDMRKAYLNDVSYAIDFVNKNKTLLTKNKCAGFK